MARTCVTPEAGARGMAIARSDSGRAGVGARLAGVEGRGMAMRIDVAVGDLDLERELAAALRRMGCPSGESWSVVVAARGSSWELLLDGPPRRSAGEWQTSS